MTLSKRLLALLSLFVSAAAYGTDTSVPFGFWISTEKAHSSNPEPSSSTVTIASTTNAGNKVEGPTFIELEPDRPYVATVSILSNQNNTTGRFELLFSVPDGYLLEVDGAVAAKAEDTYICLTTAATAETFPCCSSPRPADA